MAELKCPECPDYDGFCMSTSQPLSKVAPYEWCRKYLEGLVIGVIESICAINNAEDKTYLGILFFGLLLLSPIYTN